MKKEYLTEQDLAGYIKEIDLKKFFGEADEKSEDELQREIDIAPKEVVDKYVDRSLIKTISVTKTYRKVTIPEDIYNHYLKNEENGKTNLLLLLENSKEDPQIEIDITEDITND